MNTPDTSRETVERPEIVELMDLIERFGIGMFDCGEYAEPSDSEGYDELCNKNNAMRVKIRNVLRARLEALDIKMREESVRADFADEACRRISAERDKAETERAAMALRACHAESDALALLERCEKAEADNAGLHATLRNWQDGANLVAVEIGLADWRGWHDFAKAIESLKDELGAAERHNDTDMPLDELLGAISDLVMDFKPDADSDCAGVLTERVEAAVDMAKQLTAAQARVAEVEGQLHALRLVAGTTDANRFQTSLDRAQARIQELEKQASLDQTTAAEWIGELTARESKLREALEDAERRVKIACDDWVSDDTEVKSICEKHGISPHHNESNAFKSHVECVTELSDKLTAAQAREQSLREALEMITGRRQCADALMSDKDIARAALAGSAQPSAPEGGEADDDPRIYPCRECGTMRNKAEGGATFTVCDECWDKSRQPDERKETT